MTQGGGPARAIGGAAASLVSNPLWLLALSLLFGALAAVFCASATAALTADYAVSGHPIYFEVNRGQAPRDVLFLSRGMGYVLNLTAEGAVIVLHDRSVAEADSTSGAPGLAATIRITPENAQALAGDRVRGVGPLEGKSHFFPDDNQNYWLTGIDHFRKVHYPQVYPGIDLLFHAERGRLEVDFILDAGIHPGKIGLSISGDENRSLDENGNLVLAAGRREVTLQAPVSYQAIDGVEREIATRFVLGDDGVIGFELASYDETLPLRIDPVLGFSGYAGGSANDLAQGVAFDEEGNIYVAGETYSKDFPTRDPYQADSPVNGSAFVMKLDANTREVVYATYVGSNVTMTRGIAVDEEGDIHITGVTSSTNFPLVNPVQTIRRGSVVAYVARLSPGRGSLEYSTYLGGGGLDYGTSITVSPEGATLVAGYTSSINFPVMNPMQGTNAGADDGFLAVLSPGKATCSMQAILVARESIAFARSTWTGMETSISPGRRHQPIFP